MKWISRKLHGLRRRIEDAGWERYFGVDTTGLRPAPGDDGHWYVTTPYRAIFQVLDALHLTSGDVLFDVGCGKGRVLLAATRYPARKLVGVELDPGLASQARQNLARHAGKASIEIRNENALEVDYDEATALFLFDPFGAQTLQAMLGRLQQSVSRRPRPVRIAFTMAVSPASLDVLANCGWLRCVKRFDILTFAAQPFQVSVWESRSDVASFVAVDSKRAHCQGGFTDEPDSAKASWPAPAPA